MNPARNDFSSATGATPRIKQRPRSVFPCPFTRANSDDNVRRLVFGNDIVFVLMILIALLIFPKD